jgi:predicted acetyltransferase
MHRTEIRRVASEELLTHKYKLQYALGSSPPLARPSEQEKELLTPYFNNGVNLLLFDGDELLGGLVSSNMTQNVRGKLLPMSGVWDVAILPEGRRRGYALRLAQALCAALHEEGLVVSTLYPFRESFYARQGYVTFSQSFTVTFNPRPLSSLLNFPLLGRVTRHRYSEVFDEVRPYLRFLQEKQFHGFALRPDACERVKLNWYDPWVALARNDDGELIGLMSYTIDGYKGRLVADRFLYHTRTGKYLLLEWLARHIDQVKKVSLSIPPQGHPEKWWPDLALHWAPNARPMGRIIEVAALQGLEVGEGSFTAVIDDPLCDWNEKAFSFSSDNGRLVVEQVGRASSSLRIQALSALVYGTHDPADFNVLGWGDPSPDLQAEMRRMFSRKRPYLHEKF